MRGLPFVCALLTVIFAAALSTHAASTIYSSYPNEPSFFAYDSAVPPAEIMDSFTTADNASGIWNLATIRIDVYGHTYGDPNDIVPADATISIYEDNGGSAGTLVFSWDVTIDTTGIDQDFSFSAAGVQLITSTQYWFGIKATGSHNVAWRRLELSGDSLHLLEITGSEPDNTPPTVSSTSPVDGATGVVVNTSIAAIFSEPIDPTTITADTFLVNDGTSNIAGTVTYRDTTVTFTPDNSLNYSTGYTVTITTGVEDQAGNPLENTYVWSFTTEPVGLVGTEREALIALYNSTDGDHWTDNSGWKDPPLEADGFAMPGTEGNWYGITTNEGNKTVNSIYLANNNLNGTIPSEIENLTNLGNLNFKDNNLSGSIPSELGRLTLLHNLWLSYNSLTGSLPIELGTMSSLKMLSIGHNLLTGDIPIELGNLSNLESLDLSDNQLTGNIPSELGNLTNLSSISLSLNQLTGNIPAELGNLSSLRLLVLWSNLLTGSLPPDLGNLANLQRLEIQGNYFTGTIPKELGDLSNLIELSLGGDITGTIPPELGNLSKLEILGLGGLQLEGSIPSELENLISLEDLVLHDNQLTGSIPPELGNLPKLRALSLWSNQISGTIPPELGNLSTLRSLELSFNQLSGPIPPELGNLSELQDFSAYRNKLNGSIPKELGNLTDLRHLDLTYNQFSGNIPSELGNLTNLQYLYLGENQLTGSIPPELGNLSGLLYIYLNGNKLVGTIPPEIGNLLNLLRFDVGWNQLEGIIPSELGDLENLSHLSINSNMLSGSIPVSLSNLINLVDMNIGYNALYTNETSLLTFLNTVNPNWGDTQTIFPENISIGNITDTSFEVSWTPISYTDDSGGYRVFYSLSSGGPYTLFATTLDKYDSQIKVTGLSPGTTYYIVIQTRTGPHENNQNTVDGNYSGEMSASTTRANDGDGGNDGNGSGDGDGGGGKGGDGGGCFISTAGEN